MNDVGFIFEIKMAIRELCDPFSYREKGVPLAKCGSLPAFYVLGCWLEFAVGLVVFLHPWYKNNSAGLNTVGVGEDSRS